MSNFAFNARGVASCESGVNLDVKMRSNSPGEKSVEKYVKFTPKNPLFFVNGGVVFILFLYAFAILGSDSGQNLAF